jgi:hypothetical protein
VYLLELCIFAPKLPSDIDLVFSDKQAAARIWRDGQRRRVYEYRFLATGSIEEKECIDT